MLLTLQGIVTGLHSLGSRLLPSPKLSTMGMLKHRDDLVLRLFGNARMCYAGWKYSVFHPTCFCFFFSVLLCDLGRLAYVKMLSLTLVILMKL